MKEMMEFGLQIDIFSINVRQEPVVDHVPVEKETIGALGQCIHWIGFPLISRTRIRHLIAMVGVDKIGGVITMCSMCRPQQGRVKLPFYTGKGVEVKSIGKDMTMG